MPASNPSLPRQLLRQASPVGTGFSAELRALTQAALVADVQVLTARAEDLPFAPLASDTLPAGDVPFVMTAMASITPAEALPEVVRQLGHWVGYPASLRSWLRRGVSQVPLREALRLVQSSGAVFIKPVATKLFTGFVLRAHGAQRFGGAAGASEDLSEHELEQMRVVNRLLRDQPDEPVWVSKPVEFLSEWRFYVLDGAILGSARYDPDGADEAPAPDPAVVAQMIDAFEKDAPDRPIAGGMRRPRAYALDVGTTIEGADGDAVRTTLVEVNDAWALGFYARSISPAQYLEMMWARWQQIASDIQTFCVRPNGQQTSSAGVRRRKHSRSSDVPEAASPV